MRGFLQCLPFVLFIAALIVAALGAGFFTVMAFMAPITLLLCDKINMSKLIGAIAINCGCLVGANFMISGSGVIFRGLMDQAGFTQVSFQYAASIFICTFIYSIVLIALFLFTPKSNHHIGKDMVIEKPAPFTKQQTINLWLIVLMILIVLLPPVLHLAMPSAQTIAFINARIDVGLVTIVMSVIALFLGLADEKEVVAKVPWGTLIMICGVGVLVGVAIEAGTLNIISSWIDDKIPSMAVPLVIGMVAMIMSFFISTLGVVTPALFPLVPSLAAAKGISPMVLFICIVVGAQSSAISPFSSGGSLTLGACPNEEERAKLFPQLLFIAVPCSAALAAIATTVIFFIF